MHPYRLLPHANGNIIQYMHASTVDVKIGDKVLPDTVLGKTGNTGTGPIHLHVQAADATGKKINPKDILGSRPIAGCP